MKQVPIVRTHTTYLLLTFSPIRFVANGQSAILFRSKVVDQKGESPYTYYWNAARAYTGENCVIPTNLALKFPATKQFVK